MDVDPDVALLAQVRRPRMDAHAHADRARRQSRPVPRPPPPDAPAPSGKRRRRHRPAYRPRRPPRPRTPHAESDDAPPAPARTPRRPSSCSSFVDPSTSVKRNVTVPVGSSVATPIVSSCPGADATTEQARSYRVEARASSLHVLKSRAVAAPEVNPSRDGYVGAATLGPAACCARFRKSAAAKSRVALVHAMAAIGRRHAGVLDRALRERSFWGGQFRRKALESFV